MDPADKERVCRELRERGFAVVRQLLPEATIARCRKHLEQETGKHLKVALAAATVSDTHDGLPLEERMAVAYAHNPDAAPCSWVPQMRHSFVFQQLLFRDPSLTALIADMTGGREVVVGSRFNCRCKLPQTAGAAFPWHQDHAFFRMQYLLKKEQPKRLLAAWAPLTHVDATNGGVELAVGSHLGGYIKHRRSGKFLEVDEAACEASLGGAAGASRGTELPTLHPGDVMLFTDLTLHRSSVSTAQTARWSADWAYEVEGVDEICCPPLAAAAGAAQVKDAPLAADGDRAASPSAAKRAALVMLVIGGAAYLLMTAMASRRGGTGALLGGRKLYTR